MAAAPQQDDLITAINVTPLVDVVLVLLIVLMVTANAIVERNAIPLELPEAASDTDPQPADPVTLTISLLPTGELFLNREPIEEDALRARIIEARNRSSDVKAVLAADGAVAHRQVVQVIDLLRQEQVTKFAISVRPSDLEQP